MTTVLDTIARSHTVPPSLLAEAIVTELASLLERFVSTGEPGAVDLRGLPMTDADTMRLEELLGRGEVRAEIDVAGRSEVWETAYAGVWWVRHRGADDRIAAEEIIVDRIPAILATHEDDARQASGRLRAAVAGNDARDGQEESAND